MIGYSGYECPYDYDITHTTQERFYRFTKEGFCEVTLIETEWCHDEIVNVDEEKFYLNYNRPIAPTPMRARRHLAETPA